MPGRTVLHLWCACGRSVTIPYRDEWEKLARDELLRKFKCLKCRQRPNDLRRGWVMEGQPGDPEIGQTRA